MTNIDSELYELRITLLETAPPVWRRFRVPSEILLPGLHRVVQTVMGWKDIHLHQFSSGTILFGEPDPEYDTGVIDHREVRLSQTLRQIGWHGQIVFTNCSVRRQRACLGAPEVYLSRL